MTDAEIEALVARLDALSLRVMSLHAAADKLLRDVHALRLRVLTAMPTTGRQ